MENYIKNFHSFDKTVVYDFRLGAGGIADYLVYFMITLTNCISSNAKLYHKINNLEIEKYIKLKYDFLYITKDEISKLKDVTIKCPHHYYGVSNKYDVSKIPFNEVFYFDNIIKENVKNILPSLPNNYISIHLRLGDKFLETDQKFVMVKKDVRNFTEKTIYKYIEKNKDKNIVFFCDNNSKRLEIKNKYENVIISDSEIGHTSLSNTTDKQILDSITDFYILSNSQSIYAASRSGFSKVASKFNNVTFIFGCSPF